MGVNGEGLAALWGATAGAVLPLPRAGVAAEALAFVTLIAYVLFVGSSSVARDRRAWAGCGHRLIGVKAAKRGGGPLRPFRAMRRGRAGGRLTPLSASGHVSSRSARTGWWAPRRRSWWIGVLFGVGS